jgi:hypothetical protein
MVAEPNVTRPSGRKPAGVCANNGYGSRSWPQTGRDAHPARDGIVPALKVPQAGDVSLCMCTAWTCLALGPGVVIMVNPGFPPGSAGRVIALVMADGGSLVWAGQTRLQGGYVLTRAAVFSTGGHALASGPIRLNGGWDSGLTVRASVGFSAPFLSRAGD